MSSPIKSEHVFQAPTGTRDFYPAELNRLRYVQEAWRKTSINHGFDEIDGPTFEHLDLYTVKSGEGIVSELFSFERFGGEKKFALRPEFTPTLARMYASKAGSLPKPTKWFWMQNCYRAERPQRGRLREFSQWNCDIIGGDGTPESATEIDAEVISCCADSLMALGLGAKDFKIKINDRRSLAAILMANHVLEERHQEVFALLDKKEKLTDAEFEQGAARLGIPTSLIVWFRGPVERPEVSMHREVQNMLHDTKIAFRYLEHMDPLRKALLARGIPSEMFELSQTVIRGLAYYTGMVFEVHEASGAERAIAGGGRYDKLIEMFGGPPTPAVGFGMGDVVLSLVLQDKGLMPTDDEIAVRLGLSPHVFLFAAENKENPEITKSADAAVVSTLAAFRQARLHARRSYKSTRNIGKLLGDATKLRSQFALIIETGTMGQLKDLKSGEQTAVDLREVVELVRVRVGV